MIVNSKCTTRADPSLPSLQPTGDCVSLSESTALISGGTTGLVTWEAALLLAQWALQNPAVFRDRYGSSRAAGMRRGLHSCRITEWFG